MREVAYEQSRYITLYRLGWRRHKANRRFNERWLLFVRQGWQARQETIANPYTITLASAVVEDRVTA